MLALQLKDTESFASNAIAEMQHVSTLLQSISQPFIVTTSHQTLLCCTTCCISASWLNSTQRSVSTMQDIFGIYIFAFVLSFLMYLCTVTKKGQDGRLQSTPFFRFLSAITMAMPAGVPAVMIFCIVVALQKLRGRGITSLYPGQLKMAANVDIACFDKTGTLTGSEVSHSICLHMPYCCPQSQALTPRAWTHGRAVKPVCAMLSLCTMSAVSGCQI